MAEGSMVVRKVLVIVVMIGSRMNIRMVVMRNGVMPQHYAVRKEQ